MPKPGYGPSVSTVGKFKQGPRCSTREELSWFWPCNESLMEIVANVFDTVFLGGTKEILDHHCLQTFPPSSQTLNLKHRIQHSDLIWQEITMIGDDDDDDGFSYFILDVWFLDLFSGWSPPNLLPDSAPWIQAWHEGSLCRDRPSVQAVRELWGEVHLLLGMNLEAWKIQQQWQVLVDWKHKSAVESRGGALWYEIVWLTPGSFSRCQTAFPLR